MHQKIDLNKVTHSVRAAQAVLQYGVGAMVDFPDQMLVTAAPEFWSETVKIYDDRFAKGLGVDYFASPTNISYTRFPEWYFCPKCRKFQPLSKWIAEYRSKANRRYVEDDWHMVRHMQCPDCRQDLVPSRIVTVCEKGHLNDFPWIKWVHKRDGKPICDNPSLQFKTGASGTEGLEGLLISCSSCGAKTTLANAFDKNIFQELDKNDDGSTSNEFLCEGNHPHKLTREPCNCYPRTVQRGSSSVYFPLVYSSIVIPPYADYLNSQIENSQAYANCVAVIDDEEPESRIDVIEKRLTKWAGKIAMEIGASSKDVERILRRKWLEEDKNKTDVTSVGYRAAEYEALSGEISNGTNGTLSDFVREEMPIEEYNLPFIKAISLIKKVRVVNALIGFSRLEPVSTPKAPGFVSVKNANVPWYPAYEVRGEGIFIEFEQNEIDKWIMRNHKITERVQIIQNNYDKSFIGKGRPRSITPKFILLHTLSHLLIKQLSFECGYSIASLSERIYCADEKIDGKEMAGIFIYTASGDSEGTLGGLVRQGGPDAFPHIFKKAIFSANSCSNDPVCILSFGQGRDSLNLAACHACVLLPETCCEEYNVLLDRGVVVGTHRDTDMGFYSEFLKCLRKEAKFY